MGPTPARWAARAIRWATSGASGFKLIGAALFELGVAGDVLFENPPLPHDLRHDDIELVTADAENRLVVREGTVGAFERHSEIDEG